VWIRQAKFSQFNHASLDCCTPILNISQRFKLLLRQV